MLDISFITHYAGLPMLIINTFIFIIVYKLIVKNWSFFTEKNVKFVRGIPILGIQWKALLTFESLFDLFKRVYNKFPNEKFIGFYDFLGAPKYLIRDPELIKQVTIKDFDHFVNRQIEIDPDLDPVFGRALFTMRDQKWKDMRSTFSPAFTGSKMRLMFSLIGEVSQTFSVFLKKDIGNGDIKCDIKKLFTRFSNDIIASCAFGLNVNSLKDRENDFYKAGDSLTNLGTFGLVKIIITAFFPKFSRLFNIRLFKEKDVIFFRQIVKDTIKYRQTNNIVRNDIIDLIMEVKRGIVSEGSEEDIVEQESDAGFATVQQSLFSKPNARAQDWHDDDLIAQCVLFFFAGFSTISLTLSFIAHALTVNPYIQEKLVEEIKEVERQLNGKPLTYETIQKLKYLDQIVSETLRMWPQGPLLDRLVTKPYTLESSDGIKVQLNVGDVIVVPVMALHSDSKYFPNPDTFDPERFNDENKKSIESGTFMPFGIGPRSCIASRFALMECKACIYELVSKFHLEKCDKTQHPIQIKASGGVIEGAKGFWMRLKVRNE